jgi:phosphate transport system substrate-binding protein
MHNALNLSEMVVAFILICSVAMPASITNADELLRYSCSVQINDAFKGAMDSFSKKTGIKVNKYETSSSASVYRLMNGLSDLASTTRPLSFDQTDMGYVQIAFCKDPLSIIINSKNDVCDIFESQLRDVFSGKITNWKELGGSDQPIVVIVPEKDSGLYQAFDYAVMKGKAIDYDLIAKRSTMVINIVEEIEWGISFVSQGASIEDNGIQSIKINGLSPRDSCYPYYQMFLFVTKGKPVGAAKAFIDFAYSDAGQDIIKTRGMIPMSNEVYLETLKACSYVGSGNDS